MLRQHKIAPPSPQDPQQQTAWHVERVQLLIGDDRAYLLTTFRVWDRVDGRWHWLIKEPHEDGGEFVHLTEFTVEADAKNYTRLFCANWRATDDPVRHAEFSKKLETLRARALGRI
jgi:hypothetical protein